MESILKTKLPNWMQDGYSVVFNLVGTLCIVVLVYRGTWYGGDKVGNISWIAGVLVAVFGCIMCSEEPIEGGMQIRAVRTSILFFITLCALCVVGSPGDGYWVNMANGQSTVTRYFLITPPRPQSIYFVPKQFSQGVIISIKTLDGVPLRCSIWANGIMLDDRNPLKLEQNFAELTPASKPPEMYIKSRLMGALAAEAEGVLAAKTSEEIYRQGQFLIPYKIGTPIGDTLSRLMLRWSGGSVTFDCKVPFES